MKKTIGIFLVICLCFSFFAGCASQNSKKENELGVEKLHPTSKVDIEKLLPYNDFLGTYSNDDYSLTAEMNDEDEMVFTVKSKIVDLKSYEWSFKGYFSDENYRVTYSGGTKTEVTYDKNNKEKSRKAVYDYGSGRIQFSDTEHLTWKNNAELLEGSNEFSREK